MEPLNTSLSQLIAPHFFPVHSYIKRGLFDEYWLKGGRGSTKSSFIAIEIILEIMRDPEANALVSRKVASTMVDSVLANLAWAIETLGVESKFKIPTQATRITYKPTGQVIIFKGMDEPTKLKSLKVKKGYFKILWLEELTDYDGMAEVRSIKQSVFRGGRKGMAFFSYNPPSDPQAWVNKAVKIQREGKLVSHSTYLNVPPAWLGEVFLQEALHLQLTDPIAYDHEYLGKSVGNRKAIIFDGKYTVRTFTPEPHWDGPYQGTDFGFAQDPTVLVRCWIDASRTVGIRSRLYIEYESRGIGVDNDDIPKLYEGDPNLPDSGIPDARKYKIRADSARPETISHIKRKGFDIEGAEKWPGSVEDGITVLRSFDIVIHTRCTGMQEEARMYMYKVDRLTKDVLPIIVDKFNHGWDAVRYALAPFIKRKPTGFFDIQ